MGADTSAVKKKHEWNPMAGEEEGMEKTKIWKAKGKAMDTNMGGSPGYQSQPNCLETRLVRKWGDIGHQRALNPRMNGWISETWAA